MHKLLKVLNIIIAVFCALLILNHVINRFIFPRSARVTSVGFMRDPILGSWNLTMDVENLTDRLITPTILIRLRNQRRKKFGPDPIPLYKNEITLSLFPKEKRSFEHRIDLATGVGEQIVSFEIRQKRWKDFWPG